MERIEAGRNLAVLGNLEDLNIQPLYSLRTEGIKPSRDAVIAMLKKLNFFDSNKNKEGKGCIHIYYPQIISSESVVIDYATGLMWEQSGSPKCKDYKEAKEYIDKLNREQYAGFQAWRLPTIEEAMSLMEPEKQNEKLYIDTVFDQKQWRIWTSDLSCITTAWGIDFVYGICNDLDFGFNYSARAVRSIQPLDHSVTNL